LNFNTNEGRIRGEVDLPLAIWI